MVAKSSRSALNMRLVMHLPQWLVHLVVASEVSGVASFVLAAVGRLKRGKAALKYHGRVSVPPTH